MAMYSTSFNISQFSGLNQTGDGYGLNMAYAREMENVNISGGSFKPMREGRRLGQELDHPIGTLAYLHRRYGENAGTLLVAVSDGKIYTKGLDSDDEWTLRYSGLAVNDCDWVTYEISEYADYSDNRGYALNERCMHEGAAYQCITAIPDTGETWEGTHWQAVSGLDPVDILLLSNATDGMLCLYGDDCTVAHVATPKKFGVIARYNERIWGAGIAGDPDMLVYSVPYDPFDWSPNADIPEDGAGDILQPTWDGDSFIGLKQYGNTLLAIKRNSIWQISGTNPGDFTMSLRYGGGTIGENTVAVYNDRAYMMGEHGIMCYDGSGAYPFQQEVTGILMKERVKRKIDTSLYVGYNPNTVYQLGDRMIYQDVPYWCIQTMTEAAGELGPGGPDPAYWDEVPTDPVQKCCAGMWDGVYCLAIPLDGSDRCNAVLQYDTVNRTFGLRTGTYVSSFLQINERLFYTSDTFPGAVFELDDTRGAVKPVKWISGYQDLGLKSSIKSVFTTYLMVESEVPITLWLGIRTEKKLKQKIVTTKPGKLLRTHLNVHGRVFRLEIQSFTAAPYTIAGGVKVDLELDPD